MPEDGGALLRWHGQQAAAGDDWESWSVRLFRYYQTAAYPQARAAAERMYALDPGNPDVERFRMYLDYYAEQQVDGPLAASAAWLQRYQALGAPGQAMSGQVAEMRRFQAELQAEQARRRAAARADRRARWLPLAALALFAAFGGCAAFATRRR